MARTSKAVEATADVIASLKPVLAPALREIAKYGEKVEASATGLLSAIRTNDIRTLDMFDSHVLAAYQANKWHTRPGRPSKDRRSVPHTVRTYVWEIRSAFRADVKVWTCKTMYELRLKRKAALDSVSAVETTTGENGDSGELPAGVAEDLKGVRITGPEEPNGALFHDLVLCFLGLPQDQRALFGRQLARLLHRYQPAVRRATANGERPAAAAAAK